MGKKFDRLSDDWSGLKKIAVFGFGRVGRSNIGALGSRFQITKIIDNNKELQGQTYRGIDILSLKEYAALNMNDKIVVVTSGNRFVSISQELEENGYKEYVDFCDFATFFSDYFWNDRHELFLGRLGISVTTFCTLNCKNCIQLIPHDKDKKYFSIDRLKEDVRLIFEFADYVNNINIFGGEPFLHDGLEELIDFIGGSYRTHIGNLSITTNGTLKVSEGLLHTMKEHNVAVRISDYTEQVDYGEKLNDFCRDLERHDIDYVRYGHMEWLDMGFPNEKVNMGDTPEELRKHMLRCNPNCQNISEGKLYYCVQGWSAEKVGLFKLKETDYIDLKAIAACPDKKEQFRKFYFGGPSEGYFSFCKVCRGWDTGITVPGGVQCTQE